METFPSDLEIAREAKLKPIPEIAADIGIGPHLLEPYRESVAKIKLEAIEELAEAVAEAAEEPTSFRFLYPDEASLREKIETIAREVYGARASPVRRLRSRSLKAPQRAGCRRMWKLRHGRQGGPGS
jgi:formate--tetrahydrofolate ligase